MNAHSPESCATCNRVDCHLSFVSREVEPVADMAAFVLDEAWPEHRRFVASQVKPGDQVIAPGLPGLRFGGRYDWGQGASAAVMATVMRHLAMRQVAGARGAARQAAYLRADGAVAQALAKRMDWRARHVVVHQTLLPFLWREGMLGGRTFDVLMTRYPLADLHAKLDAVFACHPDSPTIHDFRAPESVVAAEAEALAAARRIVTPHHDLAETFLDRAVWLDWERPSAVTRRAGERVAFLGPTITRQGAHEVRNLAGNLKSPLIVFGAELEGPAFWHGVAIERRAFGPGWLDDVGAILHPAAVTNAPRKLLQALASGIDVYAHASCGLAPGQYKTVDAFRTSAHLKFN